MSKVENNIILLAGRSESSTYLYNGLVDKHPISKVIFEDKINTWSFLRKRIRKLGVFTVLGQVLFQLTIPKLLKITSQGRIKEILHAYQLDGSKIPDSIIESVTSVNSKKCIQLILATQPDLILVNGTRIISKKVLECTNARFVNIHVGITPKYRGVHGGYWALTSQDDKNFGVTVHFVDPGIDTGDIIAQQTTTITTKDNFVTYPLVQLGEGITLLKNKIGAILDNNLPSVATDPKTSKIWYHPTLWYYLNARVFRGVK